MSQKFAYASFLTGLATFLTSLGEFFSTHSSWSEMAAPKEIGHIIVMLASLVITIVGALNVELRGNDIKLSENTMKELNKDGSRE